MEIWKNIKGYEGIYQVSNFGRVKRISKWCGSQYNKRYIPIDNICTQYEDEAGYPRVCLSLNNIQKWRRVHRLVAETFIQNLNNLPEINHKDENKKNNNVNNLEWCTRSYNCNYGTRGIRISKANLLKGSKKRILQYDLNGNFIKEWNSLTEASNILKLNITHISQCCHNKRNKCGNYMWKFKQGQAIKISQKKRGK